MLIRGDWTSDTDGIERPTILAHVLDADGNWVTVTFLVDTGADSTVLHASLLDALGLDSTESSYQFSGIGGGSETVSIRTRIKLIRSDQVDLIINGPFPAFTDPLATDCSILGRDVLKLFTLIADPFTKTLSLIRDRHRYTIMES